MKKVIGFGILFATVIAHSGRMLSTKKEELDKAIAAYKVQEQILLDGLKKQIQLKNEVEALQVEAERARLNTLGKTDTELAAAKALHTAALQALTNKQAELQTHSTNIILYTSRLQIAFEKREKVKAATEIAGLVDDEDLDLLLVETGKDGGIPGGMDDLDSDSLEEFLFGEANIKLTQADV